MLSRFSNWRHVLITTVNVILVCMLLLSVTMCFMDDASACIAYRVRRSARSVLKDLQSCYWQVDWCRRACLPAFCFSGTTLSLKMTPNCVTASELSSQSTHLDLGNKIALFMVTEWKIVTHKKLKAIIMMIKNCCLRCCHRHRRRRRRHRCGRCRYFFNNDEHNPALWWLSVISAYFTKINNKFYLLLIYLFLLMFFLYSSVFRHHWSVGLMTGWAYDALYLCCYPRRFFINEKWKIKFDENRWIS